MITLEEILELNQIKKQINDLYEVLNKKANDLWAHHGEATVYYPIPETETGQKFVRIKIIDNIRKLKEDAKVFVSTSFKPIDMDIDFLKREPKEKAE